MWGDGGRFYWGSRGPAGVVVLFAWLSSQEKNLRPYVDLYSSLGWGSLICHVDFLTLFLPEKAVSLARNVLSELVKEVKIKQLPIILAAFSGGSKGCMYKVLQGKCEGQPYLDDYQILSDCICGQIYDSSPVDFTSDLGTRFVLHPTVLKISQPPRVVSWMAKALASGLDTIFINRFEAQRAEYWQTLYSSVSTGPILIFCSENDDLAPYQVVYNFAQRLQELGADVKFVKWNVSPHVAHYKCHQADYKGALTEFLGKIAVIYSQRKELNGVTMGGHGRDDISKSVCHLQKAVGSSDKSLQRLAVGPSDHFYLPSSLEYHETKGAGSVPDEQKGELFHMQNRPGINAQGVLGQILFDVCVPKNIEGWDIKPSKSLHNIQTFGSSGGNSPFNPIKCIRRSKL